jgi:hypothetical protein
MSVRLPALLRQELDSEFRRQQRKKEFVVSCALQHFLALPVTERDRLCSQASPQPARANGHKLRRAA